MKVRIQRTSGLKAKSAVQTPRSDKNARTAKVERLMLFPKLIESNGEPRFCVPTFDEEDFLLCCRYLYYCRNTSLISDQLYDEFEKVFLKIRPKSLLGLPGSDNPDDYSPCIRALGLYFTFKLTQREEKLLRKKLLIKRK